MSMRTIVTISACVITLTFADANARMYQWSHPSSGTVQLSGAAPAWYRSTMQGPRVLVFENGQLIDDTAVAVGEPLRESLRAAAFPASGTAAAVAATTPQPRERGRDTPAPVNDESPATEATAEPVASEQENDLPPEGTVEQTVAELKSLLDAWDSRRRDEARSLLFENDAHADGKQP